MPTLVGIAIRGEPGASMRILGSVKVSIERGLEGNLPGGGRKSRKRQVTILSVRQWVEMREELNDWPHWSVRRANLYLSGWRFGPDDVGKIIEIGDEVRLEIMGETTPCGQMDKACPGLKAALAKDWRGGVYCRVVKGGTIYPGDDVRFV